MANFWDPSDPAVRHTAGSGVSADDRPIRTGSNGPGLGKAPNVGGGNDDGAGTSNIMADLRTYANVSQNRASNLFAKGGDALDSLQKYLAPILGGDRNAMLEAVSPEVRTVSDQYDSAYKSISQLGPRGGGRNSALADARTREASDVAGVISGARSKAMNVEHSILQTLFSTATQLDASSIQALGQVLGGALSKDQMDAASSAAWGQALGSIAGYAILAAA